MKIELTVSSCIRSDDDEQQTTQTVNGFLRSFDDYIELSYREAEGDEGLGNTLTTVRLYTSKMELIRRGDYVCVLTLEVGNTHECLYQTPFGQLTLTTAPTAYASSITSEGNGCITVCYDLSAAGGSSSHELTIRVRAV